MGWTCALRIAADCVGGDLFDRPIEIDGQDACLRCAAALGEITLSNPELVQPPE